MTSVFPPAASILETADFEKAAASVLKDRGIKVAENFSLRLGVGTIKKEHVFDLVSLEESVYERNYYYDIPGNWFYGAYLQAGIDMDLTQRISIFANISGGFALTNPKTFAGLSAAMSDAPKCGSLRVQSFRCHID